MLQIVKKSDFFMCKSLSQKNMFKTVFRVLGVILEKIFFLCENMCMCEKVEKGVKSENFKNRKKHV